MAISVVVITAPGPSQPIHPGRPIGLGSGGGGVGDDVAIVAVQPGQAGLGDTDVGLHAAHNKRLDLQLGQGRPEGRLGEAVEIDLGDGAEVAQRLGQFAFGRPHLLLLGDQNRQVDYFGESGQANGVFQQKLLIRYDRPESFLNIDNHQGGLTGVKQPGGVVTGHGHLPFGCVGVGAPNDQFLFYPRRQIKSD